MNVRVYHGEQSGTDAIVCISTLIYRVRSGGGTKIKDPRARKEAPRIIFHFFELRLRRGRRPVVFGMSWWSCVGRKIHIVNLFTVRSRGCNEVVMGFIGWTGDMM